MSGEDRRAPAGISRVGLLEGFVASSWQAALILACVLGAPPLRADDERLPAPRDLAAETEAAARAGRTMLLLFSEAGCPFCERARREFLLPLQRNAAYRARLSFAEIDVHSVEDLRDFDGRRTTYAELARRYRVRLLPTVMLFGPGGRVLAEPLVGFNGPDFYGAYLDARIDEAAARRN